MKNKTWTKRGLGCLLRECSNNSKSAEQIAKQITEKMFDEIAFEHVNNLDCDEDIKDLNTCVILPDEQKIILIAWPDGPDPFFIRFFKYGDPVFNTVDLRKH